MRNLIICTALLLLSIRANAHITLPAIFSDHMEAKARTRDNLVEVEAPVEHPRAVRFACRNDSNPSLFNSAGLPASCFEAYFDTTGTGE
jgi:hypothetical protein